MAMSCLQIDDSGVILDVVKGLSRHRFSSGQVVVSVEHASFDLPRWTGHLGLSEEFLRSHHGWDPGAAAVGQRLAEAFDAPLHLGEWSRLLVDLNRSCSNPRVIPSRSGHRKIPGNADLDLQIRQERLDRYWRPYRMAAEKDLDEAVARHGQALHLSIHSFTPRLRGDIRRNHFGLLYCPSWKAEKAMADSLARWLADSRYRVRRNYPYSGLDDGFCMRMRAGRSRRRYLGMEIEINQALLRPPTGVARCADVLLGALREQISV